LGAKKVNEARKTWQRGRAFPDKPFIKQGIIREGAANHLYNKMPVLN